MSSRSGRRSRSRSRSRDSRKSSRKDRDRPWLRKSKSRSRSRSNSSSSSSRSRSSRRKNRRSRSRSKSPVRPVMSKDPKYVNARIFVANFASDKANSSDLQKIFKRHGKIVDILVHHNGYGFVQFALEEDARRAIEAETGTIFHGKSLKCNMAGEGRKDNDDGQKGGGGGDKGRDRGGGSAPDIGMGRGGPAFPPRDDRYGRDNRDPYGPPPMGDPYMRGREMSPLPRDYRGLPPPPFGRDPRGYGDLPPDFLPLRGFRDPRDLPPPPRDPIFDDPYRRPPPPDLYYDRYRDDPYRRDPYRMDPYRDPLRDPYGPGLLDPVPAPKKSMAVDCEIIIMSAELRRYADSVESSLKSMNLLTKVTVLREDQTIQQQVEDAARRSCLFAITINTQNHFHHSLSVNILHGTPQEHRNMPLKDAVELVGRSFEKFLTAEKEKLATQSQEKSPEERGLGGEGGRGGPPHPKDVEFLLKILVDNRPLSTEELDRLIDYLQEKKNKALGIVAKPQPMESDETAPSPGLQQPWPQVSSQLSTPPPQPKQQSPQYQQQQPPQYQQQQQQPPYPQQRERSPSYQQPSASYQRQQSPPYQWSQEEPQYRQQQQQPANQRPHQQEPLYQPPQQSEKPQHQPQYPQTQQQPSQYQQTHQPQSQQQQQHQYPHTPQQQQHQYPQQVGNRSQPSYQHTPPQSSYHHQEQQQQPPSTDTQDIQNKIMSIMNGGSSTVAASTINSLPQNTLPSHTSSLLMSTLTARPPPPPPPPQESSSPDLPTPSALGRGMAALGSSSSPMLSSPAAGIQSSGAAAALPHGSYQLATSLAAGAGLRGSGGGLGSYNTASSSAPAAAAAAAAAQKGATALPLPQGVSSSSSSSSSVPGVGGIPATLINFDNPTVQKALDNLIQSGPSLLKSIQATAGHTTSLATAQQTGGFRGAGRPPHPPY